MYRVIVARKNYGHLDSAYRRKVWRKGSHLRLLGQKATLPHSHSPYALQTSMGERL